MNIACIVLKLSIREKIGLLITLKTAQKMTNCNARQGIVIIQLPQILPIQIKGKKL